MNRYLNGEKLSLKLIWETVQNQVLQTPNGFVVFEDRLVDKNCAQVIEWVRRQYRGNAAHIVSSKAWGLSHACKSTRTLAQFWSLDYRIYDPDGDGRTNLEHVQAMRLNAVHPQQLVLWAVLMESCYATQEIRLTLEKYRTSYYGPRKDKRQVEASGGSPPDPRVAGLVGTETEKQDRKVIQIKAFPGTHQVTRFRVGLSTQPTDYLVTYHTAQDHPQAVQEGCSLRWTLEQFHPATQPLTGLQGRPCRQARLVRHPVACSLLGCLRLQQVANETNRLSLG